MRLFISYARFDSSYCVQIAEILDIHEVWYDQRMYAGEDWWNEILRRLDQCQGFVFLLSPHALASEYCLKEFEIARKLNKFIFPVLIRECPELPPELVGIQYADLSKGLTSDTVKSLLNAIYVAERQKPTQTSLTIEAVAASTGLLDSMTHTSPATLLGQAAEAMQQQQYDRAVFLLKQARANGYKFINMDGLLQKAEKALERQMYLQSAERDYKPIVEISKYEATREEARDAFEQYRKSYPDYDPENLEEILFGGQQPRSKNGTAPPGQSTPSPTPAAPPGSTSTQELRRINRGIHSKLDQLEWCPITGGPVTLLGSGNNGETAPRTVEVAEFYISKYPFSNGLFQVFIEDPNGYRNPKWWDYSPYAREWRATFIDPKPESYPGDNRPRDTVTWYEAMACCSWLSEMLGIYITLPTSQQWQRAAEGVHRWLYPWGDEFDKTRCNTKESKIRETTEVAQYPGGVSSFGVYDMAGNVWEWCLNIKDEDADDCNITTSEPRIIRGGSFISGHTRAQNTFYFNLNPEYHYSSIGFRIICEKL